jgi:predicted  nucleic acid-binding Zn-ribbon protein
VQIVGVNNWDSSPLDPKKALTLELLCQISELRNEVTRSTQERTSAQNLAHALRAKVTKLSSRLEAVERERNSLKSQLAVPNNVDR